ncbi:hypothetical protein DSM14862_02120 [Sulfitobacter indolifex]|uniref:Sel1 repeat family protein n=1 Tax=Sulfitobacter indolifex HEL-45 TaxID=391624 RepID=A0ABM9X517_9RHOB|nr:hypothetical protein [Sulfitobacter indolifex]EDQ04485.1 hypothetical protein OIHEL45_16189 [Sulfitobacter indolifex HEL-45]UOA19325.1 hypothetical protein DSM14862_02120 [Sulfitobacter indolifex]
MRRFLLGFSTAAILAIVAGGTCAGPLEEARLKWKSGDRNGAVVLLKPLVAEGVTDAEFALGGLRYLYGVKDKDEDLKAEGFELLLKAVEDGHSEAASFLCISMIEDTDGLIFMGAIDGICAKAIAEIGKPVPDIHFNADYAIAYLVPIGRFYADKGHDLQAASCYGAYLKYFAKMTTASRSKPRYRTELDNASKGMNGIFLQRTLRGGFRGGQADMFGPLGTEPIPPCGLSAAEVGMIAGSNILREGFGGKRKN